MNLEDQLLLSPILIINNMLLPSISPNAVITTIGPIIFNKVVCDLGCGSGEFMQGLQNAGAKKVIGVERLKELCDKASNKGFDVINDDIVTMELPFADIYYDWTPLPSALDVIDKIKDAIVIVGNMPHINNELDKYEGIRLNIKHDERNIEEIFQITIIDKRNKLIKINE